MHRKSVWSLSWCSKVPDRGTAPAESSNIQAVVVPLTTVAGGGGGACTKLGMWPKHPAEAEDAGGALHIIYRGLLFVSPCFLDTGDCLDVQMLHTVARKQTRLTSCQHPILIRLFGQELEWENREEPTWYGSNQESSWSNSCHDHCMCLERVRLGVGREQVGCYNSHQVHKETQRCSPGSLTRLCSGPFASGHYWRALSWKVHPRNFRFWSSLVHQIIQP